MKLIISVICCVMVMYNYRRNRLVSSGSLWILCYLMIFVLYPLFSGKQFDNAGLIDICAVIGIFFYVLGVFLGETISINKRKKRRIVAPDFNASYFGFWLVFVLFICSIVLKIGTLGFRAVLQGDITASQLAWSDELSMGNLFIYLMNMLIPFVIAVWIQAQAKGERVKALVCLCIFVAVSLVFSYTRLFIICTLVVILFFEIRYKIPRKQLMIGIMALVSLTFLMIFLNFFRNLGATNVANFWSYLNIEYVFESTDFGASYRWFSELLKVESPYIFPVTYLKPLFAFVPRSVWPNKPEPISLEILKMLNPALAQTGYSTAGNSVLGEGYAVFGWIGIALFPLIWGIVCTLLDRKYYFKLSTNEDKSMWVIGYYIFTAFIIISCQRGDWSQYGTIIVWLFILPLLLASKIRIKRIRFTFGYRR